MHGQAKASQFGGQVIQKGNLKYALAATDSFVAEVGPDEIFEVETELNIGGHLIHSLDEKLTHSDVRLPFVNPATGPIRVRGAKPGDMLTVEVIEVGVHGLGFTALWPGIGIFPDWVRRKEFGLQNRNVRVEQGIVHWSDTLKLEAKPMIGVIGVAPVAGGALTIDNGTHGGNLDVQEVTNGNRVMFPIFQEGAYLYCGDVHALQGDAECNGMGAIEILRALAAEAQPKPRAKAPELASDRNANAYLHGRLRASARRCVADCLRRDGLLARRELPDPGAGSLYAAWPDRRGALHTDGQSKVHLCLQG